MKAQNNLQTSHLHEVMLSDRHYISKLAQLCDLINFLEHSPRLPLQNIFMLIRPRGFGLSMCSEAIESIFNRDELLLDHIAKRHANHNELEKIGTNPVIHLSFNRNKCNSLTEFKLYLNETMQRQLWDHHVKLKTSHQGSLAHELRGQLLQLISEISKREDQACVILIDNYDIPLIISQSLNSPQEREQAVILYLDFLQAIRQANDMVKFCLLTGHIKFALSNLYSEGLPHVKDLSFCDLTATLMGFTLDEIKDSYQEEIARIAPQQGLTSSEYLDALETCYGGFVFSDSMQKVLCPASVTAALDNDGELYAYSAQGMYNFLHNAIHRHEPDLNWLFNKDGQDPLMLEEVGLDPQGKEFGSLLLQLGFVSVNKVTFSDQEHSLSWRYRFDTTNVDMRRTLGIILGKYSPELKELPINPRVFDAGEDAYLNKNFDHHA